MIAGGFFLGSFVATGLYVSLFPITALPIIWLYNNTPFAGHGTLTNNKAVQTLTTQLKDQPLLLSMVLRLAPIVPSAAAVVVMCVFKVPFRTLVLGTAMVGWVRPLFFASLGASLSSLTKLKDPSALLNETSLQPLLILFASALLVLIARVWVKHQLLKRESE